MSSEIVFYDIHSKLGDVSWNPNVWKARAALNYKGVPYKTVFVPYTKIEETLKKAGAKPIGKWSHTGEDQYPCPAAAFPDGTVTSDSVAIAKKLDELYPEKPVMPGGVGTHAVIADWVVSNIMSAGASLGLPATARILEKPDAEYFTDSREKIFGVNFAQWEPKSGSDEHKKALGAIEAGLAKLGGFIDVGGGQFLGGKEPTFGDFAVLGVLTWFISVYSEEEKAAIRGFHGGRWAKYLDALAPYSKRVN